MGKYENDVGDDDDNDGDDDDDDYGDENSRDENILSSHKVWSLIPDFWRE